MKNMKFKIESPEHSEAIQKELFRLGYFWRHSSTKIINLMSSYIITKGGRIFWSDSSYVYNSINSTETTLEELKLMQNESK